MSIGNFIRNTMQRYSDFLEYTTQYNEMVPAYNLELAGDHTAPYDFQKNNPDPSRKSPELAKLAPAPAAAPISSNFADAGATAAQERAATGNRTPEEKAAKIAFDAANPPSQFDPGAPGQYRFVPPSRGVGGMFSNLRAGLRGAASSAYTVPQAFKSAAVGSDEETRMAAKNPRWTGAYGGATGSSIRAYRVADEDLAQAEMRELESLKSSTRDRVFQSILAFTIKELKNDSQKRLKALADKDMAARKANPFEIKGPKNYARDDGYYDHNQWYYNDDVIILDEGWARDLYRHAASGLAGTGSFLKGVVPRTFGGFTGRDTEKVRGPYKDSKAYGGFMGAVQQARNAAQESLDMADIRAAESIVSRSSHPLVIKQLVSFIRAKKGLKGNEKSIATANAYLRKITKGKKTEWRTLADMPKGPYDSGSIDDIIRKQTGVDPAAGRTAAAGVGPAGGDAGRATNTLAAIEKEKEELLNPMLRAQKAQKDKLEKQGGYPVSFDHQGDKSRFTSLATTLPTPIGDGKERAISVSTGPNYDGGISVGAGDPNAIRSSAVLSKKESRNYSRSLESICNESWLDSMGKGIKAGYDSADHYLGKVPGLARLGRGAKNAYNYMTRSPKQKDFTIAPDQEDFTVAPDQDKPEIMDQDQYAKSAEMRLAYLRKKAGVKDMGSQVNAAGSGPSTSYKPNNYGYNPAMEWSNELRSRNYSRSLESIYNESFLDSIGKTVKAGYDYMTGSQKKQDEVPPEMNEKQRKIYHAMLDINKISKNEYESMSGKNKEKAFRYAIDQVLDINGIPNTHYLVNMSDEKKLQAWERARRRFHGVFGPLTDKL